MRQTLLGTSQSHSTLPATPCACMKHLYLLPLLLLASLSGHAQRTRQDFVVKTNGDTLRGEFRKSFYQPTTRPLQPGLRGRCWRADSAPHRPVSQPRNSLRPSRGRFHQHLLHAPAHEPAPGCGGHFLNSFAADNRTLWSDQSSGGKNRWLRSGAGGRRAFTRRWLRGVPKIRAGSTSGAAPKTYRPQAAGMRKPVGIGSIIPVLPYYLSLIFVWASKKV